MSQELSAFAKNRKKKKIRRFILLAILVVALLGTATYFVMEKYFVVKEISVMKSDIYKTSDISKCAAIKSGTPLHKIDKDKIIERIETEFVYLEDVEVSFNLPNQVQISFREEYGKFSVALGVELFAIDDGLNVLAKEDENSGIDRIVITTGDVKRCVVGESISFIDEDTAPILLELIETLNQKAMLSSVESIDVSDQFDIHLDYKGKFDIAMGDHQDISLKLAMVQKILDDLGSEASGSIDISDSDQAYVKLNEPIA